MSSFNVKDISHMISVCPSAVRTYIRCGKLEAEKESSHITSPYIVSTKNFAKFLCKNPSLRVRFDAYLRTTKNTRLVTVALRETVEYMMTNPDWFVYSTSGLSNLFGVTRTTIRNWVKKGYLEEDAGPGLYSRKAVKKLAKKHPRFYKFMPKRSEKQ